MNTLLLAISDNDILRSQAVYALFQKNNADPKSPQRQRKGYNLIREILLTDTLVDIWEKKLIPDGTFGSQTGKRDKKEQLTDFLSLKTKKGKIAYDQYEAEGLPHLREQMKAFIEALKPYRKNPAKSRQEKIKQF